MLRGSALRLARRGAPRAVRGARNRGEGRGVATLILLRHGESVWNGSDARFTGWCDVPLTVAGRVQAVASGQLLRARGFPATRVDIAFTSELERAHETCELALASMAGAAQESWSSDRIVRDARLNERHYGSLQGWRKNDPELVAGFGADLMLGWRRSFRERPPPMTPKHPHWRPPPAPATESLADCQARVNACFEELIKPSLFDDDDDAESARRAEGVRSGRTLLVVAHSNTIRALMAEFDCVPELAIPELHVPNSVPILYRFDSATRTLISSKLESASGGSHARWILSAENHASVRNAIRPGGMLTRAFYELLDTERRGVLTTAELDSGLRHFLKENEETKLDCAVVALAKKIVREARTQDCTITKEEFERRAADAGAGLREWGDDDFADDDAPRWD